MGFHVFMSFHHALFAAFFFFCVEDTFLMGALFGMNAILAVNQAVLAWVAQEGAAQEYWKKYYGD